MDLSKIKLVVSDLDGTLLNSNHEVSALFFELFERLRKQNIIFVAASGRPYYSIIKKLKSIKDDIIIVAENGGIVVKQNKLLLSTPLATRNLLDIEVLINSNNQIHPIYCTQFKAYFKVYSEDKVKLLSEYYPNFEVVKRIEDIKEDIIKIALYHAEDSEIYMYPIFKQLESEYEVKISGKHFLDISDNMANKGYAISMIQNRYSISPGETMIFGDYNNDLEMLKLATYSFAMENAHKNVLKTANYKTKSNNDFGVEIILEKLIEAKKINYQKQ